MNIFRQINLKHILSLLLILSLGFLGYTKLGGQTANQPEDDVQKQIKKFVEVYEIVKSKYVRALSTEEVFNNALKGMLGKLDHYSDYLTAQEYDDFEVEMKGEFAGVGVEINIEDGTLTVITPLEDSPAFRVGMLPGDRILEIDGESTDGLSISECGKRIRGKPNTKVTFTVLHKGENLPIKMTINREIVKVNSVKQAKIIDDKNKIGYLRITKFQEDTLKSFEEAMQKLKESGIKSLIIDLRFNGGGVMDPAIELANKFISQGVIISTKGREKGANQTFMADPKKATLTELPLVLLVNGGTASASEIFAGAVQDYSKGILVGSRTYGKGVIQTVINLPEDKTAVKLTIARYYTPSGKCLQRDKDKNYGLDPDILLDLTPQQEGELLKNRSKEEIISPTENTPPKETPSKFEDLQLQKALERLGAKK